MVYKCSHCGETFTEDEVVVKTWRESRGEFWGTPCSEEMSESTCPHCGSEDFEEWNPKKAYEIKVTVYGDDFDPSLLMKRTADFIEEEFEVDEVEIGLRSIYDLED